MELCKALKNAIAAADRAYMEHKDDSYFSVFYAHKKQKLEEILSRAENSAYSGELLQGLKQEQQRLTHLVKEEEMHPTFDWYGEHYWEIVYSGELAGCEEAMEAFHGVSA